MQLKTSETSSCTLQSCLSRNVHALVYRVLHVICTFTTRKLNVLSYLCVQLACTPCTSMLLFVCLFTCLSVFVFHFIRTEQVYRFFQQWCPNIHNATDEESDDDITSPGYCAPDEEVNIVDSTPWLYVAVKHRKITPLFSIQFNSIFYFLQTLQVHFFNLYISTHRVCIWWRHFILIVPRLIHIPK